MSSSHPISTPHADNIHLSSQLNVESKVLEDYENSKNILTFGESNNDYNIWALGSQIKNTDSQNKTKLSTINDNNNFNYINHNVANQYKKHNSLPTPDLGSKYIPRPRNAKSFDHGYDLFPKSYDENSFTTFMQNICNNPDIKQAETNKESLNCHQQDFILNALKEQQKLLIANGRLHSNVKDPFTLSGNNSSTYPNNQSLMAQHTHQQYPTTLVFNPSQRPIPTSNIHQHNHHHHNGNYHTEKSFGGPHGHYPHHHSSSHPHPGKRGSHNIFGSYSHQSVPQNNVGQMGTAGSLNQETLDKLTNLILASMLNTNNTNDNNNNIYNPYHMGTGNANASNELQKLDQITILQLLQKYPTLRNKLEQTLKYLTTTTTMTNASQSSPNKQQYDDNLFPSNYQQNFGDNFDPNDTSEEHSPFEMDGKFSNPCTPLTPFSLSETKNPLSSQDKTTNLYNDSSPRSLLNFSYDILAQSDLNNDHTYLTENSDLNNLTSSPITTTKACSTTSPSHSLKTFEFPAAKQAGVVISQYSSTIEDSGISLEGNESSTQSRQTCGDTLTSPFFASEDSQSSPLLFDKFNSSISTTIDKPVNHHTHNDTLTQSSNNNSQDEFLLMKELVNNLDDPTLNYSPSSLNSFNLPISPNLHKISAPGNVSATNSNFNFNKLSFDYQCPPVGMFELLKTLPSPSGQKEIWNFAQNVQNFYSSTNASSGGQSTFSIVNEAGSADKDNNHNNHFATNLANLIECLSASTINNDTDYKTMPNMAPSTDFFNFLPGPTFSQYASFSPTDSTLNNSDFFGSARNTTTNHNYDNSSDFLAPLDGANSSNNNTYNSIQRNPVKNDTYNMNLTAGLMGDSFRNNCALEDAFKVSAPPANYANNHVNKSASDELSKLLLTILANTANSVNLGQGLTSPNIINNNKSSSKAAVVSAFQSLGNPNISETDRLVALMYPYCTGLPSAVPNGPGIDKYSCKVFVGGLPPDIDEDEISNSFRHFGPLIVDWPHKAESKSFFPPKGYAFLLFHEEPSVQSLVEACYIENGKHYLYVSSPTIKDKPVQIRAWNLNDADFVLDSSKPLDPRKTIFVGGVPRPLRALELALIMDRLYGNVCYAGIDTDPELKYPKGAGRVAFGTKQSYIAAISARFVQLQHGDIDKRVEVKPYVLDDQNCDECGGLRCLGKIAPFFCANVACLQYFCEPCWATVHSKPGKEFHKPLVKEGGDRPRMLPYRIC